MKKIFDLKIHMVSGSIYECSKVVEYPLASSEKEVLQILADSIFEKGERGYSVLCCGGINDLEMINVENIEYIKINNSRSL